MSKLPNISSARTSIQNTENESSNNILDSAKEDRNIILPILNQDNNNNNNIIKTPLLLNSKLIELEARYISLEQNYEYIINKITSNEKRLITLQNNLKNNDNNLNLSKTNKKSLPNEEQDKINTNITILNNKIKYLEEMLKSDQEIRAQEKQKELDFTKELFNKINSSLTNTIQMEVEQRFKADLLQKNSNIKEIDLLQNQINGIKSQFEQMQNLFMKKLEENNNECSERNQNLAKYIDVRLDDQNLKKDSRELKKFLEKLTEQIKNNMNNQIVENESFNQKIKNSEKKLENSIKEIYDFLNKIELRTVNKLKNIKKYFDINLLSSNNLIEKNVSKLFKQFEKNFAFFSEELLSTRYNSNLEFQNIHKKIKFNNQAFVSDLENIIKHQVQLENIVINKFKEIEQMKKNILKELYNFEAKANVNLKNEKIFIDCQLEFISKELKDMSNSVGSTTEAVFSNLNKLIKENNFNNDFAKKKFITIDNNITLNKINIKKLEENIYDTVSKLLLNEMTQKVMEENILREISRIKLFEKSIKNNRTDINKLNDRIVDAFKSLGGISQQGTKINDMLQEKEIRDEVEKMMTKMVEECVIIEIKEESNKKIKNLDDKFNQKFVEQENKNSDMKLNIEENQKKDELLIKDLETRFNTSITNSNIHNSVTQIINNTEIENIYDLINGIKINKTESKFDDKNLEIVFKRLEENNETTMKTLANYRDIIDNKINKGLEKFKQDNIDMWENSVSLAQKINTPEEIKKLIQEVPPVISPLNETLQKIMDLNFKYPEPKPFIPELFENENYIDEQNYGKIVTNPIKEENKNQEINTESNNNINSNENINSNNSNNSNNNSIKKEAEKNSQGSKVSNNSKSTGSKKNKK